MESSDSVCLRKQKVNCGFVVFVNIAVFNVLNHQIAVKNISIYATGATPLAHSRIVARNYVAFYNVAFSRNVL